MNQHALEIQLTQQLFEYRSLVVLSVA